MSFDQPLLLLTLLVLPAAVVLFLLVERRRSRYNVRFTNMEVLAGVARTSSRRRYLAPLLFLVALAALGAALARPHVQTLVADERATVILVIDASRSMQSDDVRPTRLLAAEAAAGTFLDRVPKRLRVGLIVFAGDVQVAAPPTTDHELVRQSLGSIGSFTGFGGTAIGDAIVRAVEVGRQAVSSRAVASVAAPAPRTDARGLVSILFLSDGRQNRGLIQPLDGAERAKAAGIPVHTVALGTASGGSGPSGGFGFGGPRAPDPETLKAIARITGGQFYAARSAKSLQTTYAKLGSRLGRSPGRTEITYAFLLGAAALLVAAGLLSARWAPRLP
jgi:Ca-activated chloride channel family protein